MRHATSRIAKRHQADLHPSTPLRTPLRTKGRTNGRTDGYTKRRLNGRAAAHALTRLSLVVVFGVAACGDDSSSGPGDAGLAATTDHCEYRALPATAGAGGTVTAGQLRAGTAEAVLPIPIGTALGAYTARAGFLGDSGTVDLRDSPLSGAFNPSIGIESAPRAKILALNAGGETVLLIKLDQGNPYEGMVFDLEERLGAAYAGKVLISASHSHSAWAQHTAHSGYMVGFGQRRALVYKRFLDTLEELSLEAVADLQDAKLGVFADSNFDPGNEVTRDRRDENNDLMGGPRKDSDFYLLRVDTAAGAPLAIVPVFGMHGTLNGSDNSFASTDAPGAIDRILQEQFDSEVLVMHLQGAGADVSPTPHGGVDCSVEPGIAGAPCFEWLRAEGNARMALPALMSAWESAGATMRGEIEIEMVTRSVVLGPSADTFSIRDGALSYLPFDITREPADGVVWTADNKIVSPLDEFNAPVGAALCEADYPIFPAGQMPGTDLLPPYGSCVRVDTAGEILGILLKIQFESDATHPVCQSTRTTLSALRLGDVLLATVPGEPSVMLADLIRERAPTEARHTIVLGYAQGEMGYALTPEDWLQGGYECSINFWGPLEGEYLVEQLEALMPLAMTAQREDATSGGSDRFVTPTITDALTIDEPAPMAGQIPASIPEQVWVRTGPPETAQPAAQIKRVSGTATFVWIGDDPQTQNPVVTLQHESIPGSGTFVDVQRRSGRLVQDAELLVGYTPVPVRRIDDEPQTHYWVAQWQAVPWLGAADDGLGARASVPLGNYRFSVSGKNFDLVSDAFEVIAADLRVAPSRTGTSIDAQITLHAAKGYRLLDMDVPSNKRVPVRSGLFRVELTLAGASPLITDDVSIDTTGKLSVDAGDDAANVTHVRVTDAYGNTNEVAL